MIFPWKKTGDFQGISMDFPSPLWTGHPSPRLCGIVMSVCGAALATFFCGRFESHERPAARLLVNLAASLMAYTARATGMMAGFLMMGERRIDST